MIRVNKKRTIISFLFLAVLDFILYHGGTSRLSFMNNESSGPLFLGAYASSMNQNVNNNHLQRYQRTIQVGHGSYDKCCYSVGDEAFVEKPVGGRKITSKRRQAIEIIRSAKRSFRNKISQSNSAFSKIFDKKPLRKLFCFEKGGGNRLQETTRLVGGANAETEVDEDQVQSNNSSPNLSTTTSTEAIQRRKSFLRNILTPSKNFFLAGESEAFHKNLQQTFLFAQKLFSQAGPSMITAMYLFRKYGKRDEISLLTLYMLALLGASCGFHLFLHFITLGYALGVTIPLVVALLFYKEQYELPLPTVLHSIMTIVWGIRLFAFLAIREYITWPALHQKVVEVQEKMKIPFASKVLCWFLYSFFYVSLVASCWSRLVQSSTASSLCNWGLLGYFGLSLQLIGLALETVADVQKNSFKSCNRHSWCNIGVWKYSTHPHYLGEGVFWWGTYLAHGFHSPFPSILATIGLVLILYVLKGSAKSLSSKQKEKYGQEEDFYQFQRTHNAFGPKQMWSRQQVTDNVVPLQTESSITQFEKAVSVSGNGNIQEINQ